MSDSFPVTGLRDLLGGGDALIIVPPFAGLDRPALGPHVLQACAKRHGRSVRILYANLLFASVIGEARYSAICYGPTTGLAGERVFAAKAYGCAPLAGFNPANTAYFKRAPERVSGIISYPDLLSIASKAERWVDDLVESIRLARYPVVGCSTTFEQTAASIAILRVLRNTDSSPMTILGGANCEGEMAQGILSTGAPIDYVFSGESEDTFPRFLQDLEAGKPWRRGVIPGEPCRVMDDIPTPDFDEFYKQFAMFVPNSANAHHENLWLPYESSRGCWWGQKRHCTFCGINGETMSFRAKSAEKVLHELKTQLKTHPTKKVCMVDNIMPHNYFKTLLPHLAEQLPGLHVFYEQKANLSLQHMCSLKAAGVQVIQPGIEALSTPLLELMDKGVTARQNIALLRYARASQVSVNWNLLYAFPNDQVEWYVQTLRLLPLLIHLHPPTGVFHLSIDRFSPYFKYPERYGITNVRAMEDYVDVLPRCADVARCAYHFVADYPSESRENPEVIASLQNQVRQWRAAWTSPVPPAVVVTALDEGNYLLTDTRGLGKGPEFQFIGARQAEFILTGMPHAPGDHVEWAIDNGLVVEVDRKWVPLAVADPLLLRHFEASSRAPSSVEAPTRLPILSDQMCETTV